MNSSPPRVARPRRTMAVLATCGIVVSLMQTLVIPLVPDLPRLLDSTSADASWVITSCLLAGAVTTPISGRLGDMFGKRRMLIVCLALLATGSVLCALTSSLMVMVAGRVLQGAAMGAIPLGISILRDELPPAKVGGAVAVMSATLGVGGAIGLPVSAFIAQVAQWHVLFWVAGVAGVLCLVLVALFLAESPVRTPARFDVPGALGLAVGLVALLLAITKGADWGWGSATTLGLFGIAVLVLLGWAFVELRTAAPLVDLRVSARPQVLFTNFASIACGFAMYGMSLTLPQMLMAPTATGYGFGLSMIEAGIAFAPSGLVMMLLSPVSARITAAKGAKTTLMTGAVVIGLGYGLAVLLTTAVWQIVVAAMIIGAGVGLSYSAMPALIMGAVPRTETAAANGLNALMRSVGTSTSAAVMSVVLANLTIQLGGLTLPSLTGFRATFAICGAAALAALVLTAAIPGRGKPNRRAAGAAAGTVPASPASSAVGA